MQFVNTTWKIHSMSIISNPSAKEVKHYYGTCKLSVYLAIPQNTQGWPATCCRKRHKARCYKLKCTVANGIWEDSYRLLCLFGLI
ncbi:hypothetical protein CCP4SC76_6670002 [Gammaproteobacteria bacterium]